MPFELRTDIYLALSLYCILITVKGRGITVVKEVQINLKKINKGVLRFVTRDKSTTFETLVQKLNLLSPPNQRIVKMATGVYKTVHGYKVPGGIGELLHDGSTNYRKVHPGAAQSNTTTY